MKNFKLNPESPLIYLFKGNEDLLNYPEVLNTLAELSNEPVSFESIDKLFWTNTNDKYDSARLDEKISENKNQDAAVALIPYIGEMLERHRNNPSSTSKAGLSDICSLWADNDVLYKAYENSVEQSPDFNLLDALEQAIPNNYNNQNSCAARHAGFIITSINKAIALQVLNNGAVYQATIGSQSQSKDNAHTH